MTTYITQEQAGELLNSVGGTWEGCIREDKEFLHKSMNAAIQAYKDSPVAGELPEPVAYFYHDAGSAETANPLLHSTMFLHRSERRQNLRNETPLYTADQVRLAMQDHIDALTEALKVAQSVNVLLRKTRETARAERDALQTQRDMWESMFKEVRAERDALQAKLSEAQEENTANMSTCKGIISGLTTERDAMQAKLSAIEAQEPELWARYPRTGRNTPPEVVTKKPEDADSWVAFYAHPVAPAQPVNELVEALEHAVEIAEGKRDGTWDDLLQYRATIAHAKLDKLTALSEQADLYLEFTKAAQPLTKEQVEKVLHILTDIDGMYAIEGMDEAIKIMKGVRG